MRILLIIAGAVLLLWFLLPFFTKRILNIGNTTGVAVSLILLIYGIFLLKINSLIARLWSLPAGKIVLTAASVFILTVFILAVMCIVCMISGISFAHRAKPNSTVIVLGCRVYGDRASLMLKERLEAALIYLKDNPDSPCIVSGGQGTDETVTEASVMYAWLTSHGIDAERIYVEDSSSDTHENISNSKAIIETFNLPEDIAIATNGFHEYRALRIAKAAGLSAGALPGKTAWWLFPTYTVREMYGILQDWFLPS